MEETTVRNVMILIAVLTPVIGGALYMAGRAAARQGDQPMPASLRRNSLILIAAGPVNLLVWLLFNGLLAGIGNRSLLGYILAALVFILGGLATGFFARLRQK